MDEDQDNDYAPSDQDLQENVELKVQQAEEQEKLLREEYISKELELNALYRQLRDVVDQVFTAKQQEYQQSARCDPFLKEYLDELAEDELQWENVNQRYESMEDEKDYDKEMLLKKLEEINQSQKPPIEYFKGVNDVHIGFRCLVEDLNNQIFKCYQDRILLEDYQTEFNQRITALRKEIKDVTDKNEKLIKQIDVIKPQHS